MRWVITKTKRIVLGLLEWKGYHVFHDSTLPASGDHRRMLAALKARGLHCNFIMDIGAFWCGWADWALAQWPQAKAWAFEPCLEPHTCREDNLKRWPHIRLFPIALGSVNETATLTRNPGLGSAATLLVPRSTRGTYQIGEETWTQMQVPVRRLDDILAKEDMTTLPDLVKIDVEGYELEVLKGASRLLGRTEVFIIETIFLGPISGRPSPGQLTSFMEGAGYQLYDFAEIGYEPTSRRLCTMDFVFVRRNSRLLR